MENVSDDPEVPSLSWNILDKLKRWIESKKIHFSPLLSPASKPSLFPLKWSGFVKEVGLVKGGGEGPGVKVTDVPSPSPQHYFLRNKLLPLNSSSIFLQLWTLLQQHVEREPSPLINIVLIAFRVNFLYFVRLLIQSSLHYTLFREHIG